MTTPDATKLLTRAQVADLLAISVRTVDRLAAAGDLPVVRLDRRPRYLATDIEAFIQSRRRRG